MYELDICCTQLSGQNKLPNSKGTYSTAEHKEQVTVLQQLQSLLQLSHTNRSHCAHASFTSAVLTHDEQALDAPTGGTARQRHGKEGMSSTARQRKQLDVPAAAERGASAHSYRWQHSAGRSGMRRDRERRLELPSFFPCSVARCKAMLKQNTTRGSSEIRQLKSNTSFKESQ